MLFFACAINYADRAPLSVVSPQLRQEFSMTEAGILVVYLCVVGGRHGARVGGRKVVAGSGALRAGAGGAGQLAGGGQSRRRVVPGPAARPGNRHFQRRFVDRLGPGAAGGRLSDAALRLALCVPVYWGGRVGLARGMALSLTAATPEPAAAAGGVRRLQRPDPAAGRVCS